MFENSFRLSIGTRFLRHLIKCLLLFLQCFKNYLRRVICAEIVSHHASSTSSRKTFTRKRVCPKFQQRFHSRLPCIREGSYTTTAISRQRVPNIVRARSKLPRQRLTRYERDKHGQALALQSTVSGYTMTELAFI